MDKCYSGSYWLPRVTCRHVYHPAVTSSQHADRVLAHYSKGPLLRWLGLELELGLVGLGVAELWNSRPQSLTEASLSMTGRELGSTSQCL